jgi:hypothetical protein
MSAITFTFLSFLLLFAMTLRLIRLRRLNFKYSVAWISLTALALLFGIAPGFLNALVKSVGFSTASNFVLFLAVLFLAMVSLQMSVGLSRLEQRLEAIAREIALSGVALDEEEISET